MNQRKGIKLKNNKIERIDGKTCVGYTSKNEKFTFDAEDLDIIKNFTEQEIVEISLIENIQRENLNPIEEEQNQNLIKIRILIIKYGSYLFYNIHLHRGDKKTII